MKTIRISERLASLLQREAKRNESQAEVLERLLGENHPEVKGVHPGKGKKICPYCKTIVGARTKKCPNCEYFWVPIGQINSIKFSVKYKGITADIVLNRSTIDKLMGLYRTDSVEEIIDNFKKELDSMPASVSLEDAIKRICS